MNAQDVQRNWLHQESIDGVDEFAIVCDQMDLVIEADDTLTDMVQLIVEPAQNAPVFQRVGQELLLKQGGRYRGKVTPLVRVPAERCPAIGLKNGKSDLSLHNVNAPIAIKLGMGDLAVVSGTGPVAASVGKGDVAVTNRAGAVAVRLGSGDVAIDRCLQDVVVSLGKGDIALSECGDEIEVKTGSGDVAITNPEAEQLSVTSGAGDVAITGGAVYWLSATTGKGDIVSTTRLSVRPEDVPEETVEEPGTFRFFDEDDEFNMDAIRLDLSSLVFEANDDGVRIGRGDQDLLKLGPDGIQINRKGRQISLGPDGIRVGGPAAAAEGQERFLFDSGRGDVQVDIPSDLHARVEVLATGDVQSDVPLVSVGRPGPRGTVKRQVGVTEGGGRTGRVNMRLRTGRGDVALRSVRVQPREETVIDVPSVETDRDEQARVILEALSRGDLSVSEAERLLAALDR